jgi:tricarballylate dehydrogenase
VGMKPSSNLGLLVAGCGNAALSSAIFASGSGQSVSLIEAAPETLMGGNSRFTLGGMRFGSESTEDVLRLLCAPTSREQDMIREAPYSPQQFFDHLMMFSRGKAVPELAKLLSERSYSALLWLQSQGIEWGLHIHGITPEPMWKAAPGSVYVHGRGRGLVAQLLKRTAELTIPIHYEHELKRILLDREGRVSGALLESAGREVQVPCRALVLACGGFEANRKMRRLHMGEAWDGMKVRGSSFNTGGGINAALDIGAARSGEWNNGHAVPIAAESPDCGSIELGETTRRCLFQDGISVTKSGRRFMDEGADRKWFMYSTTGVAVSSQDGGTAYQIYDARLLETNFEKDFYFSGLYAVDDSLLGLARQIDVDPVHFLEEVARYNAAVVDDSRFNRTILDGSASRGITPPRSNFAARIHRPPFFAFQVVGGITFTYGGLKIDTQCRVLGCDGRPIPGLFAAGEAAGGFFAGTYPANSGLTRGVVTGLAAAQSAADYLANGSFEK